MGAPGSGVKAAEQPAAETLLTAFKTIDAAERRRHASVLNYWLSIRGDKEFPPLHDLDPLELSDAGPNSGLFELISGGHDAEIRHLGEALRDEDWPERIMDAPNPSLLACIAKKLPIVAISRDFLAFEDDFEGPDGKTRCWVTLLPLSAGGAWVDYVYALVSLDKAPAKGAPKKVSEPEVTEEGPQAEIAEQADEWVEEPSAAAVDEPQDEVEESVAEVDEVDEVDEANGAHAIDEPSEPATEAAEFEQDEPQEPAADAVAKAAPGFSKLLDSLAGLTGFYGSQPVKVDPVIEPERMDDIVGEEPGEEEPVSESQDEDASAAEGSSAEEPAIEEEIAPEAQPATEGPSAKAAKQSASVASEGSLQSKLKQVRAEADEARQAKLRANAALYEALSAAYDFALDAEESPEEYLRLVEAQGLKIQLRSPMKPVVKLAFEGMCDEPTIKQLEAVLAWAFDEELPRGALAEKIEAAGGIAPILGGQLKAA